MYDRDAIMSVIYTAEREHSYCACGAPMIPADRDGSLWLECSAHRERGDKPAGFFARLASLDWLTGHDRLLLLDATELAA
jgi:hypothetical protein